MAFPVSTEILLVELRTVRDIIEKQIAKLEAGIPGQDVPQGRPDAQVSFAESFCGELLIAAGKIETIASVVSPQ